MQKTLAFHRIEREFIVSVRKDIDNGRFQFPESFELELRMKDYLENQVDEKFYVTGERAEKVIEQLKIEEISSDVSGIDVIGDLWEDNGHKSMAGRIYNPNGQYPTLGASHFQQIKYIVEPSVIKIGNVNPSGKGMNGVVVDSEGLARTITQEKGEGQKILIRQATKQGFIEMESGGVADLSYPSSSSRRGRVQEGGNVCPTITSSNSGICKIDSDPLRIRKLTPKECFRLMGFDDEDFEKAAQVNSNTQLYKQAGNSIVVDVAEELLCMMFDEDGNFFV